MKIIIKNDNRDIVKNPNVKIIETTESSFTNQVVILENNDVPIIKYTDTESMYFVKDLDNLYDRKSKSEVLLNITIDNLELIGSSSGGDFVPLTGTEVGSPVTGDIEFSTDNGVSRLYGKSEGSNSSAQIDFIDGGTLALRGVDDNEDIVFEFGFNGDRGIVSVNDFSENITDLDYTQKIYVDKANSYSTNETLTGGTWIDGKPIYRKVFEELEVVNYSGIISIPNLETIIPGGLNTYITSSSINFYLYSSQYNSVTGELTLGFGDLEDEFVNVVLEYTKTTD